MLVGLCWSWVQFRRVEVSLSQTPVFPEPAYLLPLWWPQRGPGGMSTQQTKVGLAVSSGDPWGSPVASGREIAPHASKLRLPQ